MNKLTTSLGALVATSAFATAGISTSPWSFDEKADGWALEDKDQVIEEEVRIGFMISGRETSARLVAISAPVKKEEDAFKEFVKGIQGSFAKGGVVDLKESTATRWGIEGLNMTFGIRSEGGKVSCDAFFFEDGDKFWAVMAFGPDPKDLAGAFLALKAKE